MIIYQVDAFSDRAFSGNPAGVCILQRAMDEEWMQKIALEMNLSETAFLLRKADRSFDLRWFTPAKEVDLCGHATLAAAHILWETKELNNDQVARFNTKSGLLIARKMDDWIELDFPPEEDSEVDIIPDKLAEALGIEDTDVKYIGKNRMDYILEVDEKIIYQLQPNYSSLAAVPVRGIIVTGYSSSNDFDFVSRFFAPAYGVNEDPVTGSAHCCLGPYWQRKTGKSSLIGYQASKRGGTVKVGMNGDRVLLRGKALTVFEVRLVAEV